MTKEFLESIKKRQAQLMEKAIVDGDEYLKRAINNLEGMLTDTKFYEHRFTDAGSNDTKIESLKADWNGRPEQMYENEGLEQLAGIMKHSNKEERNEELVATTVVLTTTTMKSSASTVSLFSIAMGIALGILFY